MSEGVDGWPDVGGLTNGVAIWLLRAVADSVKTVTMSDLLSAAVRGALLVDLCLAGHVSEDTSDLQVDTAPTGFAPADAASAAIAEHRMHALSRWLQRGHPSGSVVGDVLVERGEWTSKHRVLYPRYGMTDQAIGQGAIREQLGHFLSAGSAPNPTVAALTCVVVPLGLLGSTNRMIDLPDALVGRCAAAGGLVTSVVEYLRAAEVDDQAIAALNTEATVIGGGA